MLSVRHQSDTSQSGRIVLGTWGISTSGSDGLPTSYAPVRVADCDAVLDAAWQGGVRWIDTAPSYGGTDGYTRLKSWMARTGNRFRTTIKPGRILRGSRMESCLTRSSIRDQVSEAIEDLGEPDAILVKDAPEAAFRDGSLRNLIEWLGTEYSSAHTGVASHLHSACASLFVGSGENIIQLEYNALNAPTAGQVARALNATGWRVWGMQPLAYGFLTGKYDEASVFPRDDFRSRLPERVRHELVDRSRSEQSVGSGGSFGASPAVLALAACLVDPALDRVVVGPRTPRQYADVIEAARLARKPAFVQDWLRRTAIWRET